MTNASSDAPINLSIMILSLTWSNSYEFLVLVVIGFPWRPAFIHSTPIFWRIGRRFGNQGFPVFLTKSQS